MFSLLSQPYPTEESVGRRLLKAVLIGAFVGLFLLVFQPFGLDDWHTPAKTWKILGFGLVTFGVMIAESFLLTPLFPRYFSDDHWTVGREIVHTLLFILVIAIGNRLYIGWLLNEPSTVNSWLHAIGMTFVIGVFPTIGTVLTNYIVQLRRYSQAAATLPNQMVSSVLKEPWLRERVSTVRADDAPGTTLTLVADNEKDRLSLRPDSLLFIESSDNYCTVVHLKNSTSGVEQAVKPLLRSSLSRLETQIAEIVPERPHRRSGTTAHRSSPPGLEQDRPKHHPRIVRCHRSYIVNLDRVERVTGNAQGYKLHLLGGQFQVPVARRFNDNLISQLRAFTQ